MPSLPRHPHPGSPVPTRPDDLYLTPPPWDIGRPQPALLALAEAGSIEPATIDTRSDPAGVHARLVALTRR